MDAEQLPRSRNDLVQRFESFDAVIAGWMDRWGLRLLRYSIGIVFVWFGALKPLGLSPAAELVANTVYVVSPELFVPVLGIWEVLIGLCLLYRPLIRLGILLLFVQMPGTFLPLLLLPEVTFVQFPYALTIEGQYIIKNLVMIGAALVVGATVRATPRFDEK
ncbi:MAG: hypothetical protein IH933_10220 [Euryarchaeota archaeon]|jgi:uncharacterized membrane protein YkgB|nr:hypothetical protein [Euryarchaeota archaeon]